MEAEAFAGVPVRVVYIPDDTETIGAGAFAGCPAELVIFGTPGSYAEDFAAANGYFFAQE